MKNKSKLKKIKEKNNTNKQCEWFFMSANTVDIRTFYNCLKELGMEAELWEAQEVIEVLISEEGSVDIEKIEKRFGDEFSDTFMDERNIESVFAVSFKAEVYEGAMKVMKNVLEVMEGIFCADTSDFTPVLEK